MIFFTLANFITVSNWKFGLSSRQDEFMVIISQKNCILFANRARRRRVSLLYYFLSINTFALFFRSSTFGLKQTQFAIK